MTSLPSYIADVMNDRLEKVIGEMDVELDGRFAYIRTQETNLGKGLFNQM